MLKINCSVGEVGRRYNELFFNKSAVTGFRSYHSFLNNCNASRVHIRGNRDGIGMYRCMHVIMDKRVLSAMMRYCSSTVSNDNSYKNIINMVTDNSKTRMNRKVTINTNNYTSKTVCDDSDKSKMMHHNNDVAQHDKSDNTILARVNQKDPHTKFLVNRGKYIVISKELYWQPPAIIDEFITSNMSSMNYSAIAHFMQTSSKENYKLSKENLAVITTALRSIRGRIDYCTVLINTRKWIMA